MKDKDFEEMPEEHLIKWEQKDGYTIPVRTDLGAVYHGDGIPLFVIDSNDVRWTFATRMSDNKIVKIRS